MLTNWKEDLRVALRVSVTCALIIYAPIAVWKLAQAVYLDHMGLVARSESLRETIKSSGDVQAQRIPSPRIVPLPRYVEANSEGAQAMIGFIVGAVVGLIAGYTLGTWHEFRLWFGATGQRKTAAPAEEGRKG